MANVTIVAQGRVLEVEVDWPWRQGKLTGGKKDVPRGTISGFSAASRRRLLKHLMKVKWAENYNKFITLTYPKSYPATAESKQHLRAFLERLRRKEPDAGAIWRLEFQQRGAPHFHIVSPNLPYQNMRSIQASWGEIIGFDRPFTDIQSFKKGDVVKYLAKYAAKEKKSETKESVQICTSNKLKEEAAPAWTGRCWGVHNKPAMPYHTRHHITCEHDRVYQNIRSLSTLEWKGLDEVPGTSFTLYTDEPLDMIWLAVLISS